MPRRSPEGAGADRAGKSDKGGASGDAAADVAACKELLRRGSKSFAAASLLLPERVRDPVAVVYAFCRVADDEVDEGIGGLGAVRALERRLDRACAGTPEEGPVDRALARVMAERALPRVFLEALLEGLQWDAEGRRYATLSALNAYAARVAGAVGAVMAVLMDTRSEEALARACDLGVAMQLTNVARDVGEDARRGRLYLPEAWLREEGMDPDAWLARPLFDARVGRVVARLLGAAEALYRRADAGIAMLPRDCRPAIRAASLIYADIGRVVVARRLDSVTGRAVTSKGRKAWLLMQALASPTPEVRGGGDAPPLAETRFLVEAR
ncbi:phytoene/squalene synthase family protein [Chondromyces apiculatus]|uniref:Phytoene synthase n=1 Tax=Chondromyces apiculatus DSM 436 TaxID=1192034 RepID=A0A017T4P4_9BACT|nr:phytoene/squalene synthase family protein [Chondromyces apiculatus]EYF03785.1 Phytoene synthase [Chondromyces apiculatus DSM 436]